MLRRLIQNKWTLSEEHLEKLLTVNLINLKMIFNKFSSNTHLKSLQMESLFLISLDALINFTIFNFVIPKDKIMQLQEYTLKDFQTGFQK